MSICFELALFGSGCDRLLLWSGGAIGVWRSVLGRGTLLVFGNYGSKWWILGFIKG